MKQQLSNQPFQCNLGNDRYGLLKLLANSCKRRYHRLAWGPINIHFGTRLGSHATFLSCQNTVLCDEIKLTMVFYFYSSDNFMFPWLHRKHFQASNLHHIPTENNSIHWYISLRSIKAVVSTCANQKVGQLDSCKRLLKHSKDLMFKNFWVNHVVEMSA